MCSSPLLLLLPFASFFHITSSTSYLVEVEDVDHHLVKVEAADNDQLAKANSSRQTLTPPQHQLLKEDNKTENQSVKGPKNPPVKEDTRSQNVAVDGHHKNVRKDGIGQDYTESSDDDDLDWSLSSKEEDNSDEDSDYDDEDSSSEESESGSSEFKRKLNDPEYTVVL